MKIILSCCDADDYLKEGWRGRVWKEEFDEPQVTSLDAARKWGRETIANFNRTLRTGEKARRVILTEVAESDKKAELKHDWRKASLVTERGGYDRYKCERCGAKGKRYGLSEGIVPDKHNQKFCHG